MPDTELEGIPGSLPFQSRGLRLIIFLSAAAAGGFLGFGGPQFETTSSLKLVNELHVGWPIFGLLFILYGVTILARPAVRFAGWMLGAGLYAFFGVAFIYSMSHAKPGPSPINPVLVAALFGYVVFHVVAAWNASRLAALAGSA